MAEECIIDINVLHNRFLDLKGSRVKKIYALASSSQSTPSSKLSYTLSPSCTTSSGQPAMTPQRIPVSPNPIAPLDSPLRSDLFSALIRQNVIKNLQNTLNFECQNVGWQDRVQGRILQLLRNGEVKTVRELEGVIVEEALEREDKEGGTSVDEDDDDKGAIENDVGREKRRRGNRRNVNDDAVVNIKLPEKATTVGTKVVRAALEDAVVVEPIEEEDVPVWRDWR